MKKILYRQNGLFVVLLMIAFALRLYQLNFNDYWYDEMVSVHFADVGNWWSIFWDSSPPLYPFLLKIWVRLFNDSEAMTRYLSVLFSMASLSLLWFYQSPRSAVLYTFSVISLISAREARPYALYELLAIINFLIFSNYLKTKSNGKARGYFLSQLGLILVHYFALIPILTENLFLFFKRRRKIFLIFPSLVGIAAIGFFLFQFKPESISWMKLKFKLEPWGWTPYEIFNDLTNYSFILFSALILMLAWDLRKWKKQTEMVQFVLISLIGPILAFAVFSRFTGYAFFVTKYFMFLVPALIFYIDLKIEKLPKLKFRLASMAIIAVLSVRGIISVYQGPQASWSAAADLIAASPQPVVFTTRSVALGAPYLSKYSIPVQKLNLDASGMKTIESFLNQNKTIWILETRTAFWTYFEAIQKFFSDTGYKVEATSLSNDTVQPAMLIKISRSNLKNK